MNAVPGAPAPVSAREGLPAAALDQLDASPDPAFDALVRQAARCSASPIAALTVFTGQRAFSKAAVGMLRHEAALLQPLCARVVASDHAQVLRGIAGDEALEAAGRRTAQALQIEVYAGVPVRVHGLPVGTLCTMGPASFEADDAVLQGLHDLATACGGLVESRLAALPALAREAGNRAAQRAQQLLNQTLEGLAASVMISDADGRILMANQRWHRQIGALLPRGCDRWPDAVRHLARAGHYQQAVGREDAFVAWRLSLPAPSPKPQETQWRGGWVLLNDRLLPDGTVVHLSMDITDRRRAAMALAEEQSRARTSDARMRAVLGAVPDLWFVIDDDGRYRHCSDPDHPAIAWPYMESRGRSMFEVLPPDLSAATRAAVQRARATGETQRQEYELEVRGVPGWYEARISPMPHGELLYLVRDLTELRALAAEVRLNEARWKFALDGAGHGVWDWHADTGNTYFSSYWKEMLGYADHEIGNRWDEWSSRVHPDDLPVVLEALRAYQHGEAPAYEIDYRMRHRDGHELWIRDRGQIVARRADGSALRMVGTQSDITRQRSTEAALRNKQAAELASRSKSEFLSRMSHEMRTPLNAVIGFAQLLRLQGGARLDYVDHVLEASQHLLTLINDVLDLQQVEEGRLNLHLQPVAAAPLVNACATMLQPLAQARGVTQQLPAAPANLPRLVADEQRLRQVLLNIGSNAIKYNRPGGQVRWSMEATPGGVLAIVVEDTGSGMTEDQQARLFQPFERLGRESSIEGSGLGLLIARRLVGDMGGAVALSSQPGVGTRVRIELPVEAMEAYAAAPPPAGPAETAEKTAVEAVAARAADDQAPPLQLLYLEDNRVNALLFAEALRQHTDIELHIAETGAQAFELLEGMQPDVLVLDANLPDCSGYDVLARIRGMPALARVPAYMCSADAAPEDMARAREAGFEGYWAKPLDLSRILADLRRLGAGIR
ncbi:ATP-binding protein [Aquincola sp. MAHUQ-54]|uniref:histidine kinase n=1 Tax=Aquincola agrisoli TaxID=3119538 RepID=A0AAW9QFJ4_9BURK